MVDDLAGHLAGLEVERVARLQPQAAGFIRSAGQDAVAQGEAGGQAGVGRSVRVGFGLGDKFHRQLVGERPEECFFVGDEIGVEHGVDPSDAGQTGLGDRLGHGGGVEAPALTGGLDDQSFDGPGVNHVSGSGCGWGR